jgi:hypothetical protein
VSVYDFNKHLTTLTAGTLVLIGTFMKDIFPDNLAPASQYMIAGAIAALVFSMCYSVLAMRDAIEGRGDSAGVSRLAITGFLVGIGGFLAIVYLTQIV